MAHASDADKPVAAGSTAMDDTAEVSAARTEPAKSLSQPDAYSIFTPLTPDEEHAQAAFMAAMDGNYYDPILTTEFELGPVDAANKPGDTLPELQPIIMEPVAQRINDLNIESYLADERYRTGQLAVGMTGRLEAFVSYLKNPKEYAQSLEKEARRQYTNYHKDFPDNIFRDHFLDISNAINILAVAPGDPLEARLQEVKDASKSLLELQSRHLTPVEIPESGRKWLLTQITALEEKWHPYAKMPSCAESDDKERAERVEWVKNERKKREEAEKSRIAKS